VHVMLAGRRSLAMVVAWTLGWHMTCAQERGRLERIGEETEGCLETCLEPTGRCESDVCVCEAGYGGLDCQSTLRSLASGDVYRNQVLAPQKWDYYELKLPDTGNHGSSQSSGKVIEFGFRWTGGSPIGYIKYEQFPTSSEDSLVFDFGRVASYQGGVFRLDANRVSNPGPYYLGIQNGVQNGEDMTYSLEMETYNNSFMRLSPVISIVVGGIAAVTLCIMLFACKKLATARVSNFLPRRSSTIRTANVSRVAGLPKDAVDSFEVKSYRDLHEEADVACAICLDDFQGRDKVTILPQCAHIFHVGCVKEWLAGHTTCPICRTDLSRDQSNEGCSHDLLEGTNTQEHDDSVNIEMRVVPYTGVGDSQAASALEQDSGQVQVSIRQDTSDGGPMLNTDEVETTSGNANGRTPNYHFIV